VGVVGNFALGSSRPRMPETTMKVPGSMMRVPETMMGMPETMMRVPETMRMPVTKLFQDLMPVIGEPGVKHRVTSPLGALCACVLKAGCLEMPASSRQDVLRCLPPVLQGHMRLWVVGEPEVQGRWGTDVQGRMRLWVVGEPEVHEVGHNLRYKRYNLRYKRYNLRYKRYNLRYKRYKRWDTT